MKRRPTPDVEQAARRYAREVFPFWTNVPSGAVSYYLAQFACRMLRADRRNRKKAT